MWRGLHLFFFFKQKTAYEMRISDWSSDVCSSDLIARITSAIQFQNDRVEELSRRHGELMEQAVERAAAVAQQIAGALEQKIVTLEQAVSRASGEAGRIGTSFVESAQAITTAAEVTVAPATAASESFGRETPRSEEHTSEIQ